MNRNPEIRAPFDPAKLARDRNNRTLEIPTVSPSTANKGLARSRPARPWDVRPLMRMARQSSPVKGRRE